jgi:subtilase family serine protease
LRWHIIQRAGEVVMANEKISGAVHRFGQQKGSTARRRSLPRIASLLGVLVLPAAGLFSPSAASAGSAGSAGSPLLARIQAAPYVPDGARAIGALSASAVTSGAVVLKPRDNAALENFIAAATDKSSPSFHQYLPAGAFANRFGPAPSAISAVSSQLKANGLAVTGESRDGLLMSFSGTARQVESTFHTGLERYRLRDGSMGLATTSAISMPPAIAGSVAAVLGLNDLVQVRPVGIARAPVSARGKIRPPRAASTRHTPGSPTACGSATAAARAFGGLTDAQIANAYGAFGLYGSGDVGASQHIACSSDCM